MPRRASRAPTPVALKSLRVIAPQPAHGVRENRAAVIAAVRSFAIDIFVIVILFFEHSGHSVIGNDPISLGIATAIVVGAVLQKNTDWLPIVNANDLGIFISALNVREAADVADDLAELIGPIPRDGPRANRAAAHP